MIRYMRDTNTVSHLIRGNATVGRRVVRVPMARLCISAITKGELWFGLARPPGATRFHAAVAEFLRASMCCRGTVTRRTATGRPGPLSNFRDDRLGCSTC